MVLWLTTDGVATRPRAYYGAHMVELLGTAGIAVNSHDPLRDYTDVLYLVDIPSKWSLHFVSTCRDILPKSIFSILSDPIS
jgi:hypothetical protein